MKNVIFNKGILMWSSQSKMFVTTYVNSSDAINLKTKFHLNITVIINKSKKNARVYLPYS